VELQLKSFKQLREACWTGYKAVGTKKKGDRIVPNCVPVKEDGGGGGGMGAGAISVPGPTNKTGPQSATDPVSATAVNMKKKKRYATLVRPGPKM
jgi:hypothetical protein